MPVADEREKGNFLNRSRAAKSIEAMTTRRALIVAAEERTVVIDYAIRSRLSRCPKLGLKDTLIPLVEPHTEKTLAPETELDLRFVIVIRQLALPVVITAQRIVDAP